MSTEPGLTLAARPRHLPAFVFLLALLALGVIAIVSLRTPARPVAGLPDQPELAAVQAQVHGRLRVESGRLRFHSTLLGEGGDADVVLATRAGRALHAMRLPWRGDPRLLAAVASLDLAAHRYPEAERLFRRAVEIAPWYGEARLGFGVTLALRADAEGEGEHARGLRLRAISQFAAVAETDPVHGQALYDRVLLLARVGRVDEARQWAGRYAARDPGSAWAVSLERELDAAPR